MNRLSIKFNNEEILGVSVCSERPKNDKEFVGLLEEIVASLKAPSVPFSDSRDAEPEMDLATCENCGEKGWDNYICHACGHKNI